MCSIIFRTLSFPSHFCWVSVHSQQRLYSVYTRASFTDFHNLAYNAKAKEDHKPSTCCIGWRQRTSRKSNRLQRHVHRSPSSHAGRTSPPANRQLSRTYLATTTEWTAPTARITTRKWPVQFQRRHWRPKRRIGRLNRLHSGRADEPPLQQWPFSFP